MTTEEFANLGPGDIVIGHAASEAIMVTANYGGRVTAVRTFDLTNPPEWQLLRKVETKKNSQP